MNLDAFQMLPLRGGYLVLRVIITHAPMIDALGRPAVARTTIAGSTLEIELCRSHADDPDELSISLYHEILEAVSVASESPPPAVWHLNEAGFEAAAKDCHQRLGPASPTSLNQMLEEFGF